MELTGIEGANRPPEGAAPYPRPRKGLREKLSKSAFLMEDMHMNSEQIAYFATGCFWGAERRFWQMTGVKQTRVGYMGGTTSNPTYKEVCSGRTNHAEVVKVVFNPAQVTYEELLSAFWQMHDPTTLNRQGNDIGTQYRSSIFYTSEEQMRIASKSRDIYQSELNKLGFGAITTEIVSAPDYWDAEEYHQRYLEKNPNGYDCHATTGVEFPVALLANQN